MREGAEIVAEAGWVLASNLDAVVFGNTTTFVPTSTRLNRSATSSLVNRIQPLETNFPIVEGSFVP